MIKYLSIHFRNGIVAFARESSFLREFPEDTVCADKGVMVPFRTELQSCTDLSHESDKGRDSTVRFCNISMTKMMKQEYRSRRRTREWRKGSALSSNVERRWIVTGKDTVPKKSSVSCSISPFPSSKRIISSIRSPGGD